MLWLEWFCWSSFRLIDPVLDSVLYAIKSAQSFLNFTYYYLCTYDIRLFLRILILHLNISFKILCNFVPILFDINDSYFEAL